MEPALAQVHLMVQDPSYGSGTDALEKTSLGLPDGTIDRFLDGPATRRIAVVDFDPATGAPLPAPAPFVADQPAKPTKGSFATIDLAPESREFLAVNAFGTVFETVEMFESVAGLGRQVVWAFPGEQLLVVPRAGKWANAYYDRATGSLQFFWFDGMPEVVNGAEEKPTIYTALSRDIIAHECGHALLDAVVPSVHDAMTPESIAIHEAVADLVAVLMAIRSKQLRKAALAANDNSIDDAGVFGWIAEQFGTARPNDTGIVTHALRNLRNDLTMTDVKGEKNHVVSTVLSALFYESLIEIYNGGKANRLDPANPRKARSESAAANAALASAEIIFKRLLLRGIDYLPPGELTFADVVRATLAADRAGDVELKRADGRKKFADRAVTRQIARSVEDVLTDEPAGFDLTEIRLEDLRDSDWAAYRFVEEHRVEFGIPPDTPFKVLPRVDATKEIGIKRPREKTYDRQRELIVKVAWDVLEDNEPHGAAHARRRRLETGATLAIRWDDKHPLALVCSDVTRPEQKQARDELIHSLVEAGELTPVPPEGPGADPTAGTQVRIVDDIADIVGTHRLLHFGGDR